MGAHDLPAAGLAAEMTAWRRDFHAHPELGFAEERTAARVAELLESFGIEVHRGVGGTGVVGVLQRGNGQRSIGLRADMDALPINEVGGRAHGSTNPGVMHACGHDGHTAMLLGAACQLSRAKNINGRVVFIFQPNEEHGQGAAAMIADGLLERFDVDDVYAMHNMPGMAVGSFATRAGPVTASEALFEIDIAGRGGHAALPHMGVDAIVVGAEVVTAVQTIVSRRLDPAAGGVVSLTGFETDGKRNVVAGRARLSGDARALSEDVNRAIEAGLRDVVEGVCRAHGATATVTYETIFPATVNGAGPVKAAVAAAAGLVGESAVDGNCPAKRFSEDFAHLAAARPGCFLLMGNGVEGAGGQPLHSPCYDFNDEALVFGASFWIRLVEEQLS